VNRDSIIKGLAILSAVAAVLFVCFVVIKLYLNEHNQGLRAETAAPVTLDANDALKATIDTLETSWQTIQGYTFRASQDPLYLGRVIKDFTYSKAGFKESEEEENIRLTATVVDANPKAIIKYRNKSYVVQVGENIEKAYKVISISEKQVVLESASGRIVLNNKPVQQFEEENTGGESNLSNNGGTEEGNY
jgi:hypothetical protein